MRVSEGWEGWSVLISVSQSSPVITVPASHPSESIYRGGHTPGEEGGGEGGEASLVSTLTVSYHNQGRANNYLSKQSIITP